MPTCITTGKKPIILPKEGRLTELIVLAAHNKLGCSEVNQLYNEIRKTFWFISMKSKVKKILDKKCMKCKLQRKLIPDETVAPLPSLRVNEGNAFENVAMDIAGNFLCKDNENTIE